MSTVTELDTELADWMQRYLRWSEQWMAAKPGERNDCGRTLLLFDALFLIEWNPARAKPIRQLVTAETRRQVEHQERERAA